MYNFSLSGKICKSHKKMPVEAVIVKTALSRLILIEMSDKLDHISIFRPCAKIYTYISCFL